MPTKTQAKTQTKPTTQKKPFRITQRALDAMALRFSGRAERRVDPFRIHALGNHPFKPPEQILAADQAYRTEQAARDGASKLAMDSAPGFAGWASDYTRDSPYLSAFNQGLAFIGYPYLSELAQRPEYYRISQIIATEMTRKWIKLQSTTDAEDADDIRIDGKEPEDKTAKIKELEDYMNFLNVRENFKTVAMQDGLFGRAHLYLDTGATHDRDELMQSIGDGTGVISKNKVNQKNPLREIVPVEAVWCYPLRYNSTNPLRKDFYKPQHWWALYTEVSNTRLLTFIGRDVPDLLKAAYDFGGISMTQIVMPTVNYWLRTRKSVNDLIHYFSVFGIKTQLETMLQEGQEEELGNRARFFAAARDNHDLLMLDKDTEDFFINAAPLSGLDELQAQALEHICVVSGLPLVKYTGISPHGLNASSEGEIRVFYDWINAYQHHFFDRHLKTIMHFSMLSLWGEIDKDITFEYEPLWSLDDVAEAGKRKTEAETDEIHIGLGVISPQEARKRLAADADSPYADLDINDMPEVPQPGQEGGPEDIDIKHALEGRPLTSLPGSPKSNQSEQERAGAAAESDNNKGTWEEQPDNDALSRTHRANGAAGPSGGGAMTRTNPGSRRKPAQA